MADTRITKNNLDATLVDTSSAQSVTNKAFDATNTYPTFNQNTTGTAANVTGTVAVANGGTGATTLTGLVKGNGTSAMTAVTAPTGTVVGTSDTQTLSSKTLDNSNAYTAKDGAFTFQNSTDTTKQAVFSFGGITTGNTRTYSFPNISTVLGGLAAAGTWTAVQTYGSGNFKLNGSTSGTTTLNAAAVAGTTTATLPATTGNLLVDAATQTNTAAKTFNSGTFVQAGSTSGSVTVNAPAVAGTNTITWPAATGNVLLDTNNSVPANSLATNAITLGYAQITANVTTTSTTSVQATGLSASVTIPAGGRRVKITAFCDYLYNTVAAGQSFIEIWDGTVGTGTMLSRAFTYAAAANNGGPATAIAVVTPSAGAKTYNVGFRASANTAGIEAAATYPAFILVEAI